MTARGGVGPASARASSMPSAFEPELPIRLAGLRYPGEGAALAAAVWDAELAMPRSFLVESE